jgi:hypothetical protein
MIGFAAMPAADGDAPPPSDIHRTAVDGVTVFWTDVPGPRIGALMFGVGRAHERAATGGISHLVEHLALAPLTQQEYNHNGFVAGNRTVLHASGTDDELAAFFKTVTTAIGDLPLDRLGMERRILRQEARDRPPGIAGTLMWYRFGNRGHGQVAADELGLGWLGPDMVAAWARTWFTRENAAMWFSGPPPANLALSLPVGKPDITVSLDPIPTLTFPAHFAWNPPRVSLSYLTERSTAAVVTLDTIARRAREILRFERGLVYDVHTDYERLEANTAHCTLSADCAADQARIVRDEILRAIDDIARDGLTADEIRRVARTFHDGLRVPQSRLGYLDGTTFDQIIGGRIETLEELIAEYAALDGQKTAEQLRGSLDTLLMCVPGETPDDGRWSSYPGWSTDVVEGRTFQTPGRRVAGVRLPARKAEQTLIVGADGVTWRSPEGNPLTVRYDECVAYRHWQGDIRELWGADGFRVRILPEEWHAGAEAVRIVDAAIPPDVVVCDEHGLGAFEDPADHAATDQDQAPG